MIRSEKERSIKEITTYLESLPNVYVTDISGLDAESTFSLRKACFDANIKLKVVKNTLLVKALDKATTDYGDLKTVMVGNTALMLSDVADRPAKLIKEFRKKMPRPILKGAYVQESVYIGDDQIKTLSSIKSKEEVIGDIITFLQSPAKNLISALQSGKNKLAGIVKTLSEKEN